MSQSAISKDIIDTLLEKAIDIYQSAFAPYSQFNVGAAILADNNEYYLGINVENASFGLGICAERNAIFSAKTQGMQYIKALAVVGKVDGVISPCGACRQIIAEFSREDTVIILGNIKGDHTLYSVEEILPFAFSLYSGKETE